MLGAIGIVAVVAGAVAATAALTGPSGCSLAGCDDGIAVAIETVPRGDRPLYLRACALGKCRQTPVSGNQERRPVSLVRLPCPDLSEETSVELTVRVLGANGKVLSIASKQLPIRRFEPNGPDCGPTCWVGNTGFDVQPGRFIPFRQAQEALSAES